MQILSVGDGRESNRPSVCPNVRTPYFFLEAEL